MIGEVEEYVQVDSMPSDQDLQRADYVVICTGFEQEGESFDRPFVLPSDQNSLIKRGFLSVIVGIRSITLRHGIGLVMG